tara:strand:- start:159 stop:1289 length:1131 start_codon:yes stop_codon:yes gene_type:complete
MGFFSKIFKGIKKVVKKIGRGIKKTFMKVGKFMNKIGIVGQIAMAFILPGIGTMLGTALQGMGSFGTALAGSTNFLAKAAGTIIKGAATVASKAGQVFRTVSNAVGNYVGEFAKTAGSKLGFNIEGAATNFFGAEGAFAKATSATGETWRAGFGSIEAISKASTDVVSSMTKEATNKWRAEDIYGEGVSRPLEQVFAKQPKFSASEQFAQRIIDPEMGVAQIKEMAAEDPFSILSSTKPKFPSEMTAHRVTEGSSASLLSRLGEGISEGLTNAKDRAVGNIQSSIQGVIDDPLGTAWKGLKAFADPNREGQDGGGSYASYDMLGLLGDTNIQQFQAGALQQLPYYGMMASLYDQYGYTPRSNWAKTFRELQPRGIS